MAACQKTFLQYYNPHGCEARSRRRRRQSRHADCSTRLVLLQPRRRMKNSATCKHHPTTCQTYRVNIAMTTEPRDLYHNSGEILQRKVLRFEHNEDTQSESIQICASGSGRAMTSTSMVNCILQHNETPWSRKLLFVCAPSLKAGGNSWAPPTHFP